MKDFLRKVSVAIKNMKDSPYDDHKTEEVVEESTKKTIDYLNQKNSNRNYNSKH